MLTNLLELITKSRDEIDSYLGNVTPEQFREDIKNIINGETTKKTIFETLKKLQSIIE